jgi:hypothetical protein
MAPRTGVEKTCFLVPSGVFCLICQIKNVNLSCMCIDVKLCILAFIYLRYFTIAFPVRYRYDL